MISIVIDYEEVNYRKEAKNFIFNIPKNLKEYFVSLFPFLKWIHRYNWNWLVADLIAGITVGIVVVPQSMGYAKIATLEPQYGLYSAFVGVTLYFLFSTSKDISIGPTSVMSLLVGQTITSVIANHPEYTGPEIAVTLSLFSGIIALFIGLFRLGIIVDLIPGPAIAGFMTGSAITISIVQWPNLFGIKGINTQNATYLIFGYFFKYLPETQLDVAFGLVGLFFLYLVRFITGWLTHRYPKYERPLFFIGILRNGVLVIISTLIAWGISRGKATPPIAILKTVPSGLKAVATPKINTTLLGDLVGTLPSVVLILILEHIAISKSFGRINDYIINPNQEIIAIGLTNAFASFFGAYPSTGSFSRTAIKARSGVKTPIAGVFSAAVVLLALYSLTPAFYYIPSATLAAIIIHAVTDLISPPSYVKQLWAIDPLELFVFIAAVIITFFTTVEIGIYCSISLSGALLLVRISRPHFSTLARVQVNLKDGTKYIYIRENDTAFIDTIQATPDGILVFKFYEALTYPNASYISEKILEQVRSRTRRGTSPPKSNAYCAWNDTTSNSEFERKQTQPIVKAIILDFSGVNNIDTTGIQALLDTQHAINIYANIQIPWYFAGISKPSIGQALISSGFGTQTATSKNEILPVISNGHGENEETIGLASDIKEGINGDENIVVAENVFSFPRNKYAFFNRNIDEAMKAANA